VFLDNSRQEFFVYLRADEKLAAFMELESASKRVSQKLTAFVELEAAVNRM